MAISYHNLMTPIRYEHAPLKSLERVMIFIDGGYLRKLFIDLFGDDNIDFFKLRNYLLDLHNRTPINSFNANLIRVYYYDGIVARARARKRLARKLKNPRLLQIHFHTLRHWKATTLYHQTKDILYVKKFLGHKSIESTLVYIQLEEALFQESDGFTVRVAETVDEAIKLLEAGFEYVTDMTNGEGSSIVKIFRKRK